MPDQRRHSRPIDVEVLPPEGDSRDSALSQVIARVMDDLVRIPGTNFRIGLDPLLGLLPGFGDTGTAFVSMSVMLQAAQLGAPKIALARMALNILINTLVGALPVAGDVFSAWFKSNRRNHQILQAYSSGGRRSTRGDWAFVIALIVVLMLIVIAMLAVAFIQVSLLFSGLGQLGW